MTKRERERERNGEGKHKWVVVVLVCCVAFFINCQPSEPFLSKYLQEDKNITEAQLDEIVWPVDTYATLAMVLPIAFLSEQIGYGYIVLASLLCREATRVILIFSQGVVWMAVTQGTYALATVGNSVLLSFAFSQLPPTWFMTTTLLFQASYHFGNVVGSTTGQLLVEKGGFPIRKLFYLSWGFTTVGLVFFILSLIRRTQNERHHRQQETRGATPHTTALIDGNCVTMKEDNEDNIPLVRSLDGAMTGNTNITNSSSKVCSEACKHSPTSKEGIITILWRMDWSQRGAMFANLYRPDVVVLWSVWWMFAYGANIIFGNYFQTFLYNNYGGNDKKDIQFGWIECGIEVASVVGNLMQLYGASKYGDQPLTPVIVACLLLVPAILTQFQYGSNALVVAVVILCGLKCIFSGGMGLASASIGKAMVGERYAFVFLVNSFAGLVVVTIVSAIASSLHANTSTFFIIIASLLGASVVILAPVTAHILKRRIRKTHYNAIVINDCSVTHHEDESEDEDEFEDEEDDPLLI
eukprot:m.44922 g.44922  ORF g.44922 m.44922 type:complete len:525 (-) comp10642_c0_seq2:1306-2880(-)